MSGGIKKREIPILCAKVPSCEFDCHTSFSFFFRLIHDISPFEACFFILLRFLGVFPDFVLFYKASLIKQMSRQGTLTTVNVAYNDQI
jgi:hypothetical protein